MRDLPAWSDNDPLTEWLRAEMLRSLFMAWYCDLVAQAANGDTTANDNKP